MLLKNNRRNNYPSDNGNILNNFNQFRNQIIASGKNPQAILNDLISSGKVTQEQVNKATEIAKSLMNLR